MPSRITIALGAARSFTSLVPILLFSLPALAQAPTPFTVSGCTPGALLYGFDESTSRVLAKDTASGVGWFDAATPTSFNSLLSSTINNDVSSVLWERGPAPANILFVNNNDPAISNNSRLYRKSLTPGAEVPVVQLSTTATDDWRIEAVNSTNTTFFLRLVTLASANVYRVIGTGAPTLLSTTASPAITPLRLSPNGAFLAYVSLTGQLTFQNTGSGAVTQLTLPPGEGLDSVHWVDDQFLVARMAAFVTPTLGRVVRIDRTTSTIVDLTLGGAASMGVRSLRMSGDRQWLTWTMSQIVTNGTSGTIETSAAAMRIADGTTTAFGGGYVVVHPLEVWTFFVDQPIVQQTSNPVNPLIVYAGNRTAPSSLPLSFYKANLKYDVSVVGRTSSLSTPPPNTNGPSFVATGNHDALDDGWILGLSWGRTITPGIYVDNPLILGPWLFTAVAPFNQSSPTITLPTTSTPLNGRLYMQAGWFSNGNLAVGRVTELPIF